MFSDAMLNKVTAEGSVLGYAVSIDFPSGAARAHTGVGELLIDGNVFYGVGELGGISQLESVGDENPSRITVELSGLPGPILQESLQASSKGSAAAVYLLVFSSDTGQLEAAEQGIVGFVTDIQISIGDENKISVTIADEFELFEMPWYEYWTDESHRASHEDDRICRYVAQIADRQIRWGGKLDAEPFIRN